DPQARVRTAGMSTTPPKVRFGLAARITLLAIGNFLLLGLVFAAYVRLQVSNADMKSFLMNTARERIIAISRQIALDLQDTSPNDRTRMLRRYSDEYGVTFYLFLNSGEQIAGDPVTLPLVVRTRMSQHPPPGAPDPLGPPPEGHGPPPEGR